jgi:hypothetical protein
MSFPHRAKAEILILPCLAFEVIFAAALSESLLARVTARANRPSPLIFANSGDQVALADSLIVLRIYSVEFGWHLSYAA